MEELARMSTEAATLEQRYADLTDRVAAAAARAGRDPASVVIVAVTKYAELEDIEALIRLGHRDFGERRVSQLVQRAAQLQERAARARSMPTAAAAEGLAADPAIRWHMIGQLQRNKCRKLVGAARLVHSIDSLKLAEELQAHAVKRDIEIDVLVQINAADEPGKGGCALTAAPHLAELVDEMFPLKARGFMTMGPTSTDEAGTRLAFERAAGVFRDVHNAGLAEGRFNILSMGMSRDFELAIELGANMIRVGSALFPPELASNDDDDEGETPE